TRRVPTTLSIFACRESPFVVGARLAESLEVWLQLEPTLRAEVHRWTVRDAPHVANRLPERIWLTHLSVVDDEPRETRAWVRRRTNGLKKFAHQVSHRFVQVIPANQLFLPTLEHSRRAGGRGPGPRTGRGRHVR